MGVNPSQAKTLSSFIYSQNNDFVQFIRFFHSQLGTFLTFVELFRDLAKHVSMMALAAPSFATLINKTCNYTGSDCRNLRFCTHCVENVQKHGRI